MNETASPREALKDLVETNGDSLLQNPDRCEGLLKDHCVGGRREISAIVGALQERIPLELRSSWQTAMTPEAMRARMVQRLEDNRGLAPAVANWAVDAWSYALGVPLPSSVIQGGEGAETGSGSIVPISSVERTGGASSVIERSGESGVALPGGEEDARKKNVKRGSWVAAAAALAAVLLIGQHASWFSPKPAPAPMPTPSPAQNQPQAQPAGQQPAAAPTQSGSAAAAQPGGPTSAQPATARKPVQAAGRAPKPQPSEPVSAELSPLADTLPAGTTVVVQLAEDADSEELSVGDTLEATLEQPLTANGDVVFPAGAHALLRVSGLEQTTGESARTILRLSLSRLSGGDRSVTLVTASRAFEGPERLKNQAERGGIGAAGGAVAGFLAGHLFHHGGTGAAIGAGGGAAVGVATSKVQPVKVHAEQVMTFRLEAAARLHTRS